MAIQDLLNPKQYVTREVFNQRLSICETCPERMEATKGKSLVKLSTCPECGCFLHLKAKLKTEGCPLEDW